MPTGTDAHTRRQEHLILFVLTAVQFTSIVDFMIVMPLGPQLEREMGLSPQGFGFIVSSYTFAAGLAGLTAAMLLDRFARRPAFLAIFAGFLLGTLACGLAPNFAWLLAARMFTGAFGGVLGGLAMAIIGDVFPENRRGWASGMLMSAFALASVLGVPLGILLGSEFGWHVPFFALAGLGLPVFALAWRILPRLDRHLQAKADRMSPAAQLVSVFTESNHRRAFALTTALMISGFTVVPFLSPYLVANVGVSERALTVIYIAGGALTLVGSPVVGRLADRYGKLRMFRLVSPAFGVAVLVATALPPVPLAVAAVAMALVMVTSAGRMVPALAMITSSVSPQRRGGFMAANSAVQHVAAGIGASLGGLILAKDAGGRLLHYEVAGAVSLVATLATLWLAGRLRRAEEGPVTTPAVAVSAAASAVADAEELDAVAVSR